jgi:hypothetical protein
MLSRLREAAVDGLVLAIKYGVVVLVVGSLMVLIAQDYWSVRQSARQGAAAFAFIQQQLQKPQPTQP